MKRFNGATPGEGSESGFTMLEILVSIALMSIVIIPLLGLMADATKIHVQLERQTRSAFLAQLKLEEVKNDATADFTSDYDATAVEFSAPDLGFKYNITDTVDIANDMKAITVVVWYDEDDDDTADERSFTLNTKVARRRYERRGRLWNENITRDGAPPKAE